MPRPTADALQGTLPLNNLAVAVSILVDWNEANEAVPISVSLEDDDAKVLFAMTGELKAGRPPQATKGAALRNALALPVILAFPKPGGYVVRAQILDRPDPVSRIAAFEVVDHYT